MSRYNHFFGRTCKLTVRLRLAKRVCDKQFARLSFNFKCVTVNKQLKNLWHAHLHCDSGFNGYRSTCRYVYDSCMNAKLKIDRLDPLVFFAHFVSSSTPLRSHCIIVQRSFVFAWYLLSVVFMNSTVPKNDLSKCFSSARGCKLNEHFVGSDPFCFFQPFGVKHNLTHRLEMCNSF
jgi:hypothetical protein